MAPIDDPCAAVDRELDGAPQGDVRLRGEEHPHLLQDEGQDTYEANVSLGLPEDSRDFTDAAGVLRYFLQGRAIRLLSNNPAKKSQLEAAGQPVSRIVPLVVGLSEHNRRYLDSKRKKGHLIEG